MLDRQRNLNIEYRMFNIKVLINVITDSLIKILSEGTML